MDLKNVIEDRYLLPPKDSKGEVQEVDGSFYNTILKRIEKNLEEGGDWTWLENVVTGDAVTAKEAITHGKKFATVFHKLGFARGDTVHVLFVNYKLNWSVAFGAWILGGIISLGDVSLDPKYIAEQMKQTNAKVLLCTPDTASTAKTVLDILGDDVGHLRAYCLGPAEGIDDILNDIEDADPDLAPEPYVPEDPKKDLILILWSSGTTGHPKGICHTHHSTVNFVANLLSVLPAGENFVTTIPLSHMSCIAFAFVAIFKRITICYMFLKNNLERLVDAIVKFRPKMVAVNAHHIIQLAELPLKGDAGGDLDSVELIMPTGSAVPESCWGQLKQKFRNLKDIGIIYGSTELGILTSGFCINNVGCVSPGCQIKIVDLQTGERCLPNTEGEICARGPAMMSHYLNRPKETEEFFDEEGFGRNGDLGMYTEDGDILCIERLKELIKYCSAHIAPTELEDVLQKHPSVLESLVYGRPEPSVMELVSAVVVLKEGHKVTEAELIEFANSQVSEYKWIRGGIIFRDNIPRNNMGKLLRRGVRDWAIKETK